MLDLTEILELIVFVAIVLLLIFLFVGEPDVSDMLRAKAMEVLK